MYKVNSTKPIQVHLEGNSSDGGYILTVIPPVEQYKTEHFFPYLNESRFEYKNR